MRTPCKLSPVFKDYLWGGQRLRTVFGKQTDLSPLAESWELSVHKDGPCVVARDVYKRQVLEILARAAADP